MCAVMCVLWAHVVYVCVGEGGRRVRISGLKTKLVDSVFGLINRLVRVQCQWKWLWVDWGKRQKEGYCSISANGLSTTR